MRKILGVLLAIILLYSAASAEGLNFSSLTPTELQEFINTARNELLRRSAINDGKLFLVDETDGVQIYLTGRGEMNWRNEYELEIVVINNSSTAVTISFDEIIVNGWETETALVSVRDIGAGKKKKDAIPIALDETDVESIVEVQEVEISLDIYEPFNYDTLKSYGPITIYFDGINWYNSPQK